MQFVDPDRLAALAADSATDFAAARPFPHLVTGDLVDPLPIREVADEVQRIIDDGVPNRFRNRYQDKYGVGNLKNWPDKTRQLILELNSSAFLEFLVQLTGIEGLVPDPYLSGGGIHEVRRGGTLDVHADFLKHPTLDLKRRVNLILFLNEDWDKSWGGSLELWNAEMTSCVLSVPPELGTAVLFKTSTTSFHGHPDPLQCPPNRSRRSVAIYYYTIGTSDLPRRSWRTAWQRRPGDSAEGGRMVIEALRAAIGQGRQFLGSYKASRPGVRTRR